MRCKGWSEGYRVLIVMEKRKRRKEGRKRKGKGREGKGREGKTIE